MNETLFVRKLLASSSFPSGEKATPKGRDWTAGLLVPTRSRATSASLARATALSTSISETVLPSTPVRASSRFATATSPPSGLTASPHGPTATGIRDISAPVLPSTARFTSRTDTSSVPPFAVNTTPP